MQILNIIQMIEMYGAVLPIAILLIDDDDDRTFLSGLYLQYKPLIYKIASDFLKPNQQEIEDAVGEAVERMCRYCKSIRAVPCNRMPSYIVRLVENICRTRIRTMMMEKDRYAFSIDEEHGAQIPVQEDVQETVFSRFYAEEILEMFDRLSMRDRELIRMRHVDQMSYAEIAKALHMREGAVRTALARAKQRLEKMSVRRKEEEHRDTDGIQDGC